MHCLCIHDRRHKPFLLPTNRLACAQAVRDVGMRAPLGCTPAAVPGEPLSGAPSAAWNKGRIPAAVDLSPTRQISLQVEVRPPLHPEGNPQTSSYLSCPGAFRVYLLPDSQLNGRNPVAAYGFTLPYVLSSAA